MPAGMAQPGILLRVRKSTPFPTLPADGPRRLPAAKGWRVIVGHAAVAEDGARLLAALRQRLPVTEAHLVELGPAIGAHAGPGTLWTDLEKATLGELGGAAVLDRK